MCQRFLFNSITNVGTSNMPEENLKCHICLRIQNTSQYAKIVFKNTNQIYMLIKVSKIVNTIRLQAQKRQTLK